MKSKTIILTSIIILVIMVTVMYHSYYTRLPDYEILNSSNFTSAGNYVESDIDVVVHKRRHNDEMYKCIESQHNNLNGIPNKLTINLYKSETDCTHNIQPYVIISIDYDVGTRNIIENP